MGQHELSPAIMMMQALGAFQNRITGQMRQRAPGELRKRDVHRRYEARDTGNRERERHLRQQAAGRIPTDQLAQIVDGRVVPL
jgi:hypothetical protein